MLETQKFEAFNSFSMINLNVDLKMNPHEPQRSYMKIEYFQNTSNYVLIINENDLTAEFRFIMSNLKGLFNYLKKIHQQKKFRLCEIQNENVRITYLLQLPLGQKVVMQNFIAKKENSNFLKKSQLNEEVNKIKKQLSTSLDKISKTTKQTYANLGFSFNTKFKQERNQYNLKIDCLQKKFTRELNSMKQKIGFLTNKLIGNQKNLQQQQEGQIYKKNQKTKQIHKNQQKYSKNGALGSNSKKSLERQKNSNYQQNKKVRKIGFGKKYFQHQYIDVQNTIIDNQQMIKIEEPPALQEQRKMKNSQFDIEQLWNQPSDQIGKIIDSYAKANKMKQTQKEQTIETHLAVYKGQDIINKSQKKTIQGTKISSPLKLNIETLPFLTGITKLQQLNFSDPFQYNNKATENFVFEGKRITKDVTKSMKLRYKNSYLSLIANKPIPKNGVFYWAIRIVHSENYHICMGIVDMPSEIKINQIPKNCDAIYVLDGGLHDQKGGNPKQNSWRQKQGQPVSVFQMEEQMANQNLYVIMIVNMIKEEIQFYYNQKLISKTNFSKYCKKNKNKIHPYLCLKTQKDCIQIC